MTELRTQKIAEDQIKKLTRKAYGDDAYTFLSYNAVTLKKLEYGRGDYLKFILRKRGAYSKSTVAIMRALLDAGVPPPRTAPPPSVMYNRVRAVFKFFGQLIEPETGKPFFNDAAWKKANGVLDEILKGFASDLPGRSYYSYKLNSRGEVKYDKDGIALIESNRGTNRTEAWHRIVYAGFRNFQHCGARLADCMLTEKKHRYNFWHCVFIVLHIYFKVLHIYVVTSKTS